MVVAVESSAVAVGMCFSDMDGIAGECSLRCMGLGGGKRATSQKLSEDT